MIDQERLCWDLITSESEIEVIAVLDRLGLWENPDAWEPLGNNENNWGMVNNQSAHPMGALSELIINSSDALLTRRCHEAKINPECSETAPKSISDAIEKFYGFSHGKLIEMPESRRTELAEKSTWIVASGMMPVKGNPKEGNPCISIIDMGEGQRPENFRKSFLSIGAGNKIKTNFVQGKYCQGSHGVLRNCGERAFKLIVSKSWEDEESPEGRWGFTITRRRKPSEGERISVAEFLTINGEIPSFASPTLSVLPSHKSETMAYADSIRSGTFVKLFEYKIAERTNFINDFSYALGSYLTAPALPIKIFETRPYKGKSPFETFVGLSEKLKGRRNEDKVEPGFPISGTMQTPYGKLGYSIYAMTRGTIQSRYAGSHGVILSVNGQKHASIARSWFGTKKIDLPTLTGSLICLIDCSNISSEQHEDIFKASRDRMEEEAKEYIETELADILKKNEKIRQLHNQRKSDEIKDKIQDNKIADDLVRQILSSNRLLNDFLVSGGRVANPFSKKETASKEFVPAPHPSYFEPLKKFPIDTPKQAEIGRRFRVQFKTDVEDSYTDRIENPGKLEISCEQIPELLWSNNPNDGIWTLSVDLPSDLSIGDTIELKYKLSDDIILEPFCGSLFVVAVPFKKNSGDADQTRKRKRNPNDGPPDDESNGLVMLPPPTPIKEQEWEAYGMDRKSALKIRYLDSETVQYFYNEDNVHLLNFLKQNKKFDVELTKSRFAVALQLLAVGYLTESTGQGDEEVEYSTLEENVDSFMRGAAAAILPVIDGLSGANT